MRTTQNLAKVFAMALRGAAQDLRANTLVPEDDEARTLCRNALGSIEAVAEELDGFAARPDPDGDS